MLCKQATQVVFGTGVVLDMGGIDDTGVAAGTGGIDEEGVERYE